MITQNRAEYLSLPAAKCAVGSVPLHWRAIKAKFHFRERKELSATGDEELLSASHLTGISKRSDIDAGMFLAESLEGYKKVYSGDVVVNTMWAWMGALGISDIDGVISPSYGIFAPISHQTHSRYYHYLFRSAPFVAEINRRSKGVWSSRLRLYPDDFLSMILPFPSLKEQGAIADFLDFETAFIDQMIEKKQRFLTQVAHRIEALVDEGISDPETPRIRFEYAAQSVRRPAVLSNHNELVRLGLYNRGRGIFKKPAADEEGMGDSDFFFVKEGDLILSGQFAWEGAVALATKEEEGCVVSHRYPVYRGRQGVRAAYLVGLLRSRFGDFLLNEASRGAAGRNRPLNVRRLGKEKIPLPSDRLQLEVERAVFGERLLKAKTAQSISALEELRSALIAAAVTGQIDLTTWRRGGRARQLLDHIEAKPPRKVARA